MCIKQNEVKTRTNKNEAPVPAPANKPVEVKAGSNSKFTPSKINTANWENKDDTSNNLKKDANTGKFMLMTWKGITVEGIE